MSRLHALLDDYLALRRGLGFKLRAERLLLPGFVDFVSAVHEAVFDRSERLFEDTRDRKSEFGRNPQNNIVPMIPELRQVLEAAGTGRRAYQHPRSRLPAAPAPPLPPQLSGHAGAGQ